MPHAFGRSLVIAIATVLAVGAASCAAFKHKPTTEEQIQEGTAAVSGNLPFEHPTTAGPGPDHGSVALRVQLGRYRPRQLGATRQRPHHATITGADYGTTWEGAVVGNKLGYRFAGSLVGGWLQLDPGAR